MAKALEKAAPKRFWKRLKPWHAFGKAPEKPLGKGTRTNLEPLEKGPKPLRKGPKLLEKSLDSVSPAKPLENGSKLLGKSLNSVSPAEPLEKGSNCTETSRPTSGQLGNPTN